MKIGRMAVCTVLVLHGAASAEATHLRIGGTGAALGGMKLLAEAYMETRPESRIEVLPSLGSGGGIKAVLKGAIDLGLSSRPLKDKERAAGATSRDYARTPLGVVTSPDVAVTGLAMAELEAIVSGRTVDWPDGSPIRLVLRPPSESDTKLVRALSPGMDEAVDEALARPGLLVAYDDQENADTLEELPGAIGFMALGQLRAENRELKVLAIDGVVPTPALAAGGDHAFGKTLRIVTTPDTSPAAMAFIDFVYSASGRDVLAGTDHLPLD